MGLFEELKLSLLLSFHKYYDPHLLVFTGTMVLVFTGTMVTKPLIFKATMVLREGVGNRQGEMPHRVQYSYWESVIFLEFLNNIP